MPEEDLGGEVQDGGELADGLASRFSRVFSSNAVVKSMNFILSITSGGSCIRSGTKRPRSPGFWMAVSAVAIHSRMMASSSRRTPG